MLSAAAFSHHLSLLTVSAVVAGELDAAKENTNCEKIEGPRQNSPPRPPLRPAHPWTQNQSQPHSWGQPQHLAQAQAHPWSQAQPEASSQFQPLGQSQAQRPWGKADTHDWGQIALQQQAWGQDAMPAQAAGGHKEAQAWADAVPGIAAESSGAMVSHAHSCRL